MTLDQLAQELSLARDQLSKQAEELGRQKSVIAQHDSTLGLVDQELHRHAVILEPARSVPILTRPTAEQLYSPKVMQVQLASGGIAPLPISGLKGNAAESQAAAIPQVPQLPQLGDPAYPSGSGIAVHANGVNYRRGSLGWEPFSPISPVVSTQASGSSVVGSAAVGGDINGNLPTTNIIPKVVSSDTLGNSSISDDGTQVTTAENVGIGTTAPPAPLTVSGNGATPPQAPTFSQTMLEIAALSGSNTRFLMDAYGATSDIDFRVAGGTAAAPSAIVINQAMGSVRWSGYGTSAYSTNNRAILEAFAAENWTNTAQGTYIQVSLTTIGTTTRFVAFSILNAGQVVVGNAGADDGSGALLQVHGSVNIPTGSAYKINGVAIGVGAISQQSVSDPWFGTPATSRAVATVYQNLTGVPLFVSVSVALAAGTSPVKLSSDASASPTTILATVEAFTAVPLTFQLSGWVLPNNFYAVSGGTIVNWTENI